MLGYSCCLDSTPHKFQPTRGARAALATNHLRRDFIVTLPVLTHNVPISGKPLVCVCGGRLGSKPGVQEPRYPDLCNL